MVADSSTYTPETIARRYKIAEELLGPRKRPITHWAEGLDELAKGYFGGKMYSDAMRAEREGEAAQSAAIARMLGGSDAPGPSPMSAPAAPPSAPMMNAGGGGDYGNAIASIESGGKYDALGPVTKTGDRAYGKYQVMGNNIGPWSQAALGRSVTPQEFLANPEIQDAIFKDRFGGYVNKYGPEGAARAWFAGEGGMNNPNARDQLGTRVADYGSRFMNALGGKSSSIADALNAPPTQVAQAGVPGPTGTKADIVRMLNDPGPYVRRQGKALGNAFLLKQLEGEKPTDDQREYAQARREGFKGTLQDWITGIKKAGAQNITIDQKGQTSFSQAAGTAQAKRFDDLASEGPKAQQMLSDIQVLTDLGKNIGTGKAAQVKEVLGPFAEAVGVNVKGLSDIQAFEAIVNRMAPNLRVPGSGSQSDFELRNFLKSLPTLGNTPEGNEISSKVLQGFYENKQRAAQIGADALNEKITREEAEKQLRSLPDPMVPYREFMKARKAATESGAPTVIDGYTIRPK